MRPREGTGGNCINSHCERMALLATKQRTMHAPHAGTMDCFASLAIDVEKPAAYARTGSPASGGGDDQEEGLGGRGAPRKALVLELHQVYYRFFVYCARARMDW